MDKYSVKEDIVLTKAIIETNKFGNLIVYIDKDPANIKSKLTELTRYSEKTSEKYTAIDIKKYIPRAIITLAESTTSDFLQKADLYTNGNYYSALFRYGFIQIDEHTLIMLEDMTLEDRSLIGTLEDHVTATIQSICY